MDATSHNHGSHDRAAADPGRTVVIVAGGDPISSAALRIPDDAYVIAADSGLDEAERLGLRPDVVVGDLDSVDDDVLARAKGRGVPIERFPVDKDFTDLELALAHAGDAGFDRAILIGGHGGRLSHLLGNALVLAAPAFAAIRLSWHVGDTTVAVARPGAPVRFEGAQGDLVSLIVVGGDVTGVTTEGLRWALEAATLGFGSTRGISNEMTEPTAAVQLTGGVLLAIHERNQ